MRKLSKILFLFGFLICISDFVTSDNVMDIKLSNNLKTEIDRYVSAIVGKLTATYEIKIRSLEQRIAVLESNENLFLQKHYSGSAETGHHHGGQDIRNIDHNYATTSHTQTSAPDEFEHNHEEEKVIEPQPEEAVVGDDSAKSENLTADNENSQRTLPERKTSFIKSNALEIVQTELLPRDRRIAVTKVAFFATLDNHILNMGTNQDIIFDNVVTNIGNGYNSRHGSFIAPVSGVYSFSVTLEQNGGKTWGQFVVNGNVIAKLDVSYQSTQTIVIHLAQGDDVYVQRKPTTKLPTGSYLRQRQTHQ